MELPVDFVDRFEKAKEDFKQSMCCQLDTWFAPLLSELRTTKATTVSSDNLVSSRSLITQDGGGDTAGGSALSASGDQEKKQTECEEGKEDDAKSPEDSLTSDNDPSSPRSLIIADSDDLEAASTNGCQQEPAASIVSKTLESPSVSSIITNVNDQNKSSENSTFPESSVASTESLAINPESSPFTPIIANLDDHHTDALVNGASTESHIIKSSSSLVTSNIADVNDITDTSTNSSLHKSSASTSTESLSLESCSSNTSTTTTTTTTTTASSSSSSSAINHTEEFCDCVNCVEYNRVPPKRTIEMANETSKQSAAITNKKPRTGETAVVSEGQPMVQDDEKVFQSDPQPQNVSQIDQQFFQNDQQPQNNQQVVLDDLQIIQNNQPLQNDPQIVEDVSPEVQNDSHVLANIPLQIGTSSPTITILSSSDLSPISIPPSDQLSSDSDSDSITSKNSRTSARDEQQRQQQLANYRVPAPDEHTFTANEYNSFRVIFWQCWKAGCFKKFNTWSLFGDHMKMVHNCSTIPCPVSGCSQTFNKNTLARHHVRNVHFLVKSTWTCHLCSVLLNGPTHFFDHMVFYHKPGFFICSLPHCNFTGKYRIDLVRHNRSEHPVSGKKAAALVMLESTSSTEPKLMETNDGEEEEVQWVEKPIEKSDGESSNSSSEEDDDGASSDGSSEFSVIDEVVSERPSETESSEPAIAPGSPNEVLIENDGGNVDPLYSINQQVAEMISFIRNESSSRAREAATAKQAIPLNIPELPVLAEIPQPSPTPPSVPSEQPKTEDSSASTEQSSPFRSITLNCYYGDCSVSCASKDLLHEHLLEVHGALPLLCFNCSKSFEKCDDYVLHFMDEHASITELRCTKCGEHSRSPLGAYMHELMHHQSGQFSCTTCSFVAETRWNVVEHFRRSHRQLNAETTKKFLAVYLKCLDGGCEEIFSCQDRFNGHMASKHGGAKRCVVAGCGWAFQIRDELTGHIRKVHATNPDWRCSQCSLVLAGYRDLSLHLYYVHYIGKFRCSKADCKFTARTRQTVIDHFDITHLRQQQAVAEQKSKTPAMVKRQEAAEKIALLTA